MSEGAVSLSHLVGILAALHGSAEAVGGIQDLVGETLDHGVLATLAGESHHPTQCQGVGTVRANLDRHLVGSATHAAGANLEVWADVAQGLFQGANRVGAGLLAASLKRAVDDALCGGLLAVLEDLVDEHGYLLGVVYRVLYYRTLRSSILTHCLLLSLLCAVTGTSLLTVLDTLGIQGAADDLVTNTWKVLHTAAANEDHGVLLQIVALTWDVGRNLDTAGKAHTSNLTKSGVRLLRGGGVHAGAHATTLRGTLQRSGRNLFALGLAALADQLLNSWH